MILSHLKDKSGSLPVDSIIQRCWVLIVRINKEIFIDPPSKAQQVRYRGVSLFYHLVKKETGYEPPLDKTNKVTKSLAKTQISLGICQVWLASSLCTQWVAKDPSFLHADSKDSDQTGWMPRLILVFTGLTCHFVGFVVLRLNYGWCLMITEG